MTAEARIAILPREVASEVVTAAVTKGAFGVAAAVVVLEFPVVIDLFLSRGLEEFLPGPLLSLAVMLALVAWFGLRPSVLSRLVYLIGGSTAAVAFQVAFATAEPGLAWEATYAFNRPIVALVLLTPLVMRPLFGIIWTSIGLASGIVATGVSSVIVGQVLPLGTGAIATWALCIGCYGAVTIVRARQAARIPDLSQLEEETRRLDLERQFEQRAAAIIHDTVLSDLTAIMNTSGALDERARARFRADVTTLADSSWLRDSGVPLDKDDGDVALRNGFTAMISELQWRGLTVDISGDNFGVVALEPEASSALIAAVRACLENVLQHSGTPHAEIVFGPGDPGITVMVIDQGAGFEPDAIAHDRLGIRHSVIRRVEAFGGSVRVWSKPGSGTSIMIVMPVSPKRVAPVDGAPGAAEGVADVAE